MDTRPDKPREYFSKLLDISDEEIDYSQIPTTSTADWKNAEVLLPVTPAEFRAVTQFLRAERREKSSPIFQKSDNFSADPLRSPLAYTTSSPRSSGRGPEMTITEQVREGDLRFELDELLHQAHEAGYVEVHLRKLLRLLGKGSRAAGTWRKLLEEWELLGYNGNELFCKELPGERLLLVFREPERVRDWSK